MANISAETAAENKAESRQEAGIRLANSRMPKLKLCLVGIGRLGAYGLEKKQIQYIEKTLDKWVTETKAKLNNSAEKRNEDFKL